MTGQGATEDDKAGRAAARSRDLRAARTLALARRREGPQAPAQPTYPYLVCTCGEDRIGLPLRAVAQVLPGRPCTPVPGAAPTLAGIVALSGRIVGVVGLARALGRPTAVEPETGHLVLLRGEPPVALAVDRALAIARSTRETALDGDGVRPLGNGDASDYVPAADGSPDFTIVDPAPLLRRLMP